MNNKTATIITLIICIGISFVGYLISLVAFPLAASLIDWSPLYLSIIFGIVSFLLILICTFVICKKKSIRAAILLPLLVSIIGGIATSGARFHTREYNHGYLSCYRDLYNSMGFKIIEGDYKYNHPSYYLATSPYGEVIVGFYTEKAHDDSGDTYYDADNDEYLWEGIAKIYSLEGGYLEEKTVREWNEYNQKKILLEDLKDSYDIDCYAGI